MFVVPASIVTSRPVHGRKGRLAGALPFHSVVSLFVWAGEKRAVVQKCCRASVFGVINCVISGIRKGKERPNEIAERKEHINHN